MTTRKGLFYASMIGAFILVNVAFFVIADAFNPHRDWMVRTLTGDQVQEKAAAFPHAHYGILDGEGAQ